MLADPGFFGITTILKEVFDDFVAGFSGHWIRVLKKTSGEDHEEDFEDRMVLDDAQFAKAFRPQEITFAENTAP